MKIFGKTIMTRKRLKEDIAILEMQLERVRDASKDMRLRCTMLEADVDYMKSMFPFMLEDTVFEIQLKDSKGRFTKTKADRTQSGVIEIVADTKNYFKLVERYRAGNIFLSFEDASIKLDEICTKCDG